MELETQVLTAAVKILINTLCCYEANTVSFLMMEQQGAEGKLTGNQIQNQK